MANGRGKNVPKKRGLPFSARPAGDRRHTLVYCPASHPALEALWNRATWVGTYYDLRAGGAVAAYDLALRLGPGEDATTLARLRPAATHQPAQQPSNTRKARARNGR